MSCHQFSHMPRFLELIDSLNGFKVKRSIFHFLFFIVFGFSQPLFHASHIVNPLNSIRIRYSEAFRHLQVSWKSESIPAVINVSPLLHMSSLQWCSSRQALQFIIHLQYECTHQSIQRDFCSTDKEECYNYALSLPSDFVSVGNMRIFVLPVFLALVSESFVLLKHFQNVISPHLAYMKIGVDLNGIVGGGGNDCSFVLWLCPDSTGD